MDINAKDITREEYIKNYRKNNMHIWTKKIYWYKG